MIPRFNGVVKNGKLILDSPDRYEKYLAINLEGKKVSLTVDRQFNKRSKNQNSLYWAYLHVIEVETGNMAIDLHEYFKRIFLPPRFVSMLPLKKGGRPRDYKMPASTRELSKGGMVEYLMKINSLTQVPIPDPADWDFAPFR